MPRRIFLCICIDGRLKCHRWIAPHQRASLYIRKADARNRADQLRIIAFFRHLEGHTALDQLRELVA